MIGQVIDGHTILRALGIGGMGEVYLARDTNGREHAIKVVRTDRQASPQASGRFRRECRALARLRHPGIVGIVDAGQFPNGSLYLAMEYVNGPDLQHAVAADGAYAVPDGLALLARLASALAYAHAAHVIHRDLKPANVIIADGDPGAAKIIDFGLAKIIQEEGLTLTDEAQVLGSPGYWAPEQSTTAAVGPAADVYALGALAYVVLSGQPMFKPRPAVAMIYAHGNERPQPIDERVASVPPPLAALVAACVAKPMSERPATDVLAAELARLASAHPRAQGTRRMAKPPTTAYGEAIASQIRNVLLDLAAALEQPTDDIDRIQTELSELELEAAIETDDVALAGEVARRKRALADAYETLADAVEAHRGCAPADADALYDELDGLVERSHG